MEALWFIFKKRPFHCVGIHFIVGHWRLGTFRIYVATDGRSIGIWLLLLYVCTRQCAGTVGLYLGLLQLKLSWQENWKNFLAKKLGIVSVAFAMQMSSPFLLRALTLVLCDITLITFEMVPKTLAENAGLNAMEIISSLYAEHASGNTKVGLNLEKGACEDISALSIWDLYVTK